jgi:hypothetical protein
MRKLLRGDPDQQTGVRRTSAEGLKWTEIVRAVVKVGGKPWEELLNGRGSGARETAFFLAKTPWADDPQRTRWACWWETSQQRFAVSGLAFRKTKWK